MTEQPMPRTYVARRLLEHGPLTPREFTAITGWGSKVAHHTIERLRSNQMIRMVDGRLVLTETAKVLW